MCLAKMQFDDNDIMHLRLLQSVYLNFVGGPGPVGRFAAHACPLYTTSVQRRLPAMTSHYTSHYIENEYVFTKCLHRWQHHVEHSQQQEI